MPHPDDELLSALLDGEAPPGDSAHVDECPECQERLATLRRAASAVAATVTMPAAHLREASLAIALDAASNKPTARTLLRRSSGFSAAAALIVALAVGGLLITQLGRSGNDTANSNRDTAAAAGAGTAGVADESALSGAADDMTGPYQAGDIGVVEDITAVVERSTVDLDTPGKRAAETMAAGADTSACPVEIAGTTVWRASLTFKSEAAFAYRVETETGPVMQILRQTDCSVLESRAF